jgi:hypothetical protein
MLGAAEMQAAVLTLAWDRNPEPDIAGYVVSYGTSSELHRQVDVGNDDLDYFAHLGPVISLQFSTLTAGLAGQHDVERGLTMT